jgi:hypothetical protein
MVEGCKRRPLRNVVGLSLGGLGIAICIAALIFVWIVDARLSRATGRLIDGLDDSLVTVRERIVQIEDRIQSAKITSDELEKSLREWTKREVGERAALRLNAVDKVDRASVIVQQGGDLLETAESSAMLVNSVLSTIDSSGEPTALSALEQLIKQIASLRTQLADAAQVITTIHERLSGTSEAKLPAEKVEQVVQLTVRLAATFGDVEARLQKTTEGLSDAQNRIEEAKTRVQRWIHASAIGVTLLILLMAAGQVALCRLAAKTEY